MLKFCPSCGVKILQQSKFCHECGCSFQAALEKETPGGKRETAEVQGEIEEAINQNDFFEQFAEVEHQEKVKNEKLLKKAELLFLNYKLNFAEPLLFELSDKGNVRAQYMLGLIYENGYGGLERDVSKAIDIFANLCDLGEPLGCMHFLSFYIKDETKEYIPLLNECIIEALDDLKKSKDFLIQYEVANYYNCEHSVQMEHNTAILFYQKAAKQGYWKALTALGDMFLMGNNCMPNIKEAIQYYEKAGIKGDRVAAYILASLYYKETIIEKDLQKAKHWYSISANQNDLESLKMLANISLEEKNYFAAIKYYEKEIELNPSSDSIIELAGLYLSFQDKEYPDFPQDPQKGIMLLNRALEFDNIAALAMLILGLSYYIGEVIEQDIPKGEKYLNQAYESGNDEIKKMVKDFLDTVKNADKKSNSDGCFITTAVCNNMNKADNCYELMMFRDFRDHWLKKQPGGDLLIAEYYKIAPEIVKKIDKYSNSMEIYRNIWERYLKSCLSYLEDKDNENCKCIYTKMVNDLKENFCK